MSALSPDYQRIMRILADRERNGQDDALSCREITGLLGMELVAGKAEGVRSKANRLVTRGWLVKDAAGRQTGTSHPMWREPRPLTAP